MVIATLNKKKIILGFDFLFFKKTKTPKIRTKITLISGRRETIEILIIQIFLKLLGRFNYSIERKKGKATDVVLPLKVVSG